MKIAIATARFFAEAIIALLDDNNYDVYADGNSEFILVNTSKKKAKDGANAGDRQVFDPATQWAAITAAVSGVAAAATPVASTTSAGIAVGDQVRAVNKSNTKAKFRLDEQRVYTVARITAKGNLGLEGLPNDEYAVSRFTKVATTTGAASAAAAAPAAATRRPAAAVAAVDANGNTLRVGDTVLVTVPVRRDGRFTLAADSVQTITVITAKGNIGFGGADQYLPKRFVKVTLQDAANNVESGDKVICVREHKDSRRKTSYENGVARTKFALPLNRTLTFRGVTRTKGNFILAGYSQHEYSPARFKKVVVA